MPLPRPALPLVALLATGLVGALARPARADDNVLGTYDVKYEEVANNCTDVGMTLGRGVLEIEQKKGTSALAVDIERIPLMAGGPAKGGKLKATSKIGPTSIAGLDGKFSVAGRSQDGMLQLVFVAEYFVKGKALCSQSWNIAGVRKDKPDAK